MPYRRQRLRKGLLRSLRPRLPWWHCPARVVACALRAPPSDDREGLERQFELAYLPRYTADDQRPIGVEALLLCNHPQRGAITSGEFVPLAEETGLIAPLSGHVLERVCHDALACPPHVTVAVNISTAQFAGGTLVAGVMHALSESGLPARRLELEIAESAMIKAPGAGRAACTARQGRAHRHVRFRHRLLVTEPPEQAGSPPRNSTHFRRPPA